MSIRITARPAKGIRRVGIFHPPEPAVFPDEFFDSKEIEVLRNDPDLIVEMLDDELATAGERRHLELLTGTARSAAADDGQEGGTGVGGDSPPDVVPQPPPVAELAAFLAAIDSEDGVRAIQARDERKSAQPIYEARLVELAAEAGR